DAEWPKNVDFARIEQRRPAQYARALAPPGLSCFYRQVQGETCMRHVSSRRRAENEAFAPDGRPDAANFVYCVGCGKQLAQKSGLLRVRGAAINIYCPKCEGKHGSDWGEDAPDSYCFRCGTKHVRFIEAEPYRTIHSICPRCRPERAARYT